jgi:hypothetical protein
MCKLRYDDNNWLTINKSSKILRLIYEFYVSIK